jgi:transposase
MAQGRKTAVVISLTSDEREILEARLRSRTIGVGQARRARIILMVASGIPISEIARIVGIRRRLVYLWAKRFKKKRLEGLGDKSGRGCKPFFPPEVAIHLVKMACERPDTLGVSLSQWDCTELARKLVEEGVVKSISVETVRRILAHHKIKPWRHHMWLSPKHPRDEAFYDCISNIIDLYTRPLGANEVVLSIDEKTSLQPRPRLSPTKPAKEGNKPNLVEHEYKRDGALNLFAAFNTRTGHVIGQCYSRKRQKEFIAFLEQIDQSTPSQITLINVVCDNVSVHHGKQVKKWLEKHPRFRFHFTPVHCSWMNQVEQWFSILQSKRFRIPDFQSKLDMHAKIMDYITQWNKHAHPFNWSTKSAAKIMADAPAKEAA